MTFKIQTCLTRGKLIIKPFGIPSLVVAGTVRFVVSVRCVDVCAGVRFINASCQTSPQIAVTWHQNRRKDYKLFGLQMLRKAAIKIVVSVGSSNALLEESTFLLDTKTMCEFVQSAFMNLLCPLVVRTDSTPYFSTLCGVCYSVTICQSVSFILSIFVA